MTSENYKKLNLEEKIAYIKPFIDLYTESTTNRMKMLPSISALSATLLIVATFNQELVPINNLTKTLLIIMLLTIPLSLIFYNLDLKKAAIQNRKYILNILSIKENDITPKPTYFDKFTSFLPDLLIYIITIVIIILVFIIWQCKVI